MADSGNLAKLVPGFEFMQNLVKGAGAALPAIGQWVAPTLDPAEIDKRIEELRTVQFWLEQNARMLAATIQALEVQRMTLSTLQTMNLRMGDLRDSLQIRLPEAAPARAPKAEPAPVPPKAPSAAPQDEGKASDGASGAAPPAPGLVDPMQWWGALTKQFTELASAAVKESASGAAKNLAGAMVKQSLDAASDGLRTAAATPAKVASQVAGAAAGALSNAPAKKRKQAAKAAPKR